MATVSFSPDFRVLLESGALFAPLDDLELEYEDLLDALDDSFIDLVSQSPTLLAFVAENYWDELEFDIRFEGTGFGPIDVDQPWVLYDALFEGEATGTVDRFSVGFEGTTILSMDFTPEQIVLASGSVTLTANGVFDTGLNAAFSLAEIFVPFEEWGREGIDLGGPLAFVFELMAFHELTDATLRVGETQVARLAFDTAATTLSIGEYTITFEGLAIDFEALAEFLIPDFDAFMWPVLTLHDSDGAILMQGTPMFGSSQVSWTPDAAGTHYLSVQAADDGSETGAYRIFAWSVGQGFDRFEGTFEDADAPAGPDTPYELFIGGDFFGAITPAGDVDWVRVELPMAGISYSFSVTEAGPAPVDLFDAPGITLDGITVTDGQGRVIAEARDFADLRELIEAINEELEGLGLPPFPGIDIAWNQGDPHILTLDGAAYDFHAAGEFVMLRDTEGLGLELQARMAPVGPNVTANIAAAMRLDGGTVMVTATGGTPLWVDGAAVTLEDQTSMRVGHDLIYRDGDSYRLIHTGDGAFVTGYSAVQVDVFADRVDIAVGLDPAWAGRVEGLMGNFDGNPANDIALADGTPLERPLRFDDLYGQFRDDWRVSDEADSLFHYLPGESLAGFWLPNYPTAMVTLADFDADAIAAAQAAAEAAGLTPGTVAFENAVFDLLLTGDESYLVSAQNADQVARPPEAIDTGGTQTDGGGRADALGLDIRVDMLGVADTAGVGVTFRPDGAVVNLHARALGEGRFGLDLVAGESGHLTGMRAVSAGDPTVTTGDALQALRLAVGLQPSFGPAAPEHFIAADINGDGRVSTDDALLILRHAVGLETTHAPRWVFIDSDADLSGISAANTAVPTGIAIAGLAPGGEEFGLTGILLGNIEAL